MKVVLIDDEYYALQILKMRLEQIGNMDIVGMFTGDEEALKEINNLKPDIVFLDIEMPNTTGMKLFKKIIDIVDKVKIVFVTAYGRYAVDAFEINAFDYIVKPVTQERLEKTIDRIRISTNEKFNSDMETLNINCFGRFSIFLEEVEINVKMRKKAEELLAYLIFNKGEFVLKEKIMDDLWPEFDKEKASNNLYVTLYNLKNQNFSGRKLKFESLRGKMRICMNKIKCDIYEFERLDLLCKKVNEQTIKEAIELIDIYNGMLFEGNYYSWAYIVQARYDIIYIDTLEKIIKYYEYENNFERANYFRMKKEKI